MQVIFDYIWLSRYIHEDIFYSDLIFIFDAINFFEESFLSDDKPTAPVWWMWLIGYAEYFSLSLIVMCILLIHNIIIFNWISFKLDLFHLYLSFQHFRQIAFTCDKVQLLPEIRWKLTPNTMKGSHSKDQNISASWCPI